MHPPANGRHPASFRDPAGYIFRQDGTVYRAVQPVYQRHYEHLQSSGLYGELLDKQLMIAHEEVPPPAGYETAYRIIRPQPVPFWSYPYEWSFEQLKAAALVTLRAAKTGLAHGMILKDANAYNVQFSGGRPLLIDSLSFELYEEGKPWQALRQYCEQFLYPLILMSRVRNASAALFLAYPDGLPARLVADVLPWSSRLRFNHQLYIYLPASGLSTRKTDRDLKIPRQKILQHIDQLTGFIKGLQPAMKKTVWNTYYQETILSEAYLQHKTAVVAQLLDQLKPASVVDAGCNTGAFTLLAAQHAEQVIALDSDPGSIDHLYLELRRQQRANVSAIVADLTQPSPATGWANAERPALTARLSGELCMALALVHHLALRHNVPLGYISAYFAGITTRYLLIEFIPKGDPKAQLLIGHREDIFSGYSQTDFEQSLQSYFRIEQQIVLQDSQRVLYLCRKTD